MGNLYVIETIIYEINHHTDFISIKTVTSPDCYENSHFILRRDHEKFNELAQKLIVGHSFRIMYSFYDINEWFPLSNTYQVENLTPYNQLVGTVSKISDSGSYLEISFYNSIYKFLLHKNKEMIKDRTYKIKYLKVYNQNCYIINDFVVL